MTSPGWYPDGSTPNGLRWWDGNGWTEHVAPASPPQPAGPVAGAPQPPPGPYAQGGPGPAQPSAPPHAGESRKNPIWRRWWAIAGAVLLLLVGVGAIAVGFTGDEPSSERAEADSDEGSAEQESAVPVDVNEVAEDEAEEEPGAESVEVADAAGDDTPIEVATEDAQDDQPETVDSDLADGSRDRPFAFEEEVPVVWSTFGDADGSVWNTTVGSPRDIGTEVVAENDFNDPAPTGVVFLGFDVSMTLVGASKEPLSPGFNFSWEVNGGSTLAVYDASTVEAASFGCGVTPEEFGDFDEVLLGGTISGTVCIPVPAEDATDVSTQVVMNFFGSDRLVFSASGMAGGTPMQVPEPGLVTIGDGGVGPGSLLDPYPYGEPVDVEFESFGDADKSVWAVTVARPRDITAEVAVENQFNDPPPAGVLFVGFDVTLTLQSAEAEPLSAGFNFSWNVLGGASGTVFTESTLALGCGVVSNDFDDFAEVLVGGSVSGTVCVPVTAGDLDAPGTLVAMSFVDGERIAFS